MTIRAFSKRAIDGPLTPLEIEVTRCLLEGEQAADVTIISANSANTSETQSCDSIRRLGAQSRAERTRATIRMAVVNPPCHLCLDAHLQAVAA